MHAVNNIIKLVKKELIFISSGMKMQLGMSFLFLGILPIISPEFCLWGCIMVPYLLIYGGMAFEEKSKGEVMTAVLPVSRNEICLSRYALGVLYTVTGLVITGIAIWVSGILRPNIPAVTVIADNLFGSLLLIGALILLYTAIILPILLEFGTDKAKYIMFILYIGAFVSMTVITNFMWNIEFNVFWFVVMAVCGYSLSIMISLGIYKKREFR